MQADVTRQLGIIGVSKGARSSERIFFGVSALLFVVSATLTIFFCSAMSAIDAMPMPGGWTMSMAWMRMPGQTWIGATASFLSMWSVMMVAMMLPSLVPTLLRYRHAVSKSSQMRLGQLTMLLSTGYFLVWIIFGMIVFPLGVVLATIEMKQPVLARSVPLVVGAIVAGAGVLQFTTWKRHHLACCREKFAPVTTIFGDARTAWRHGLDLGLHCAKCCSNLMIILMVIDIMDLQVMAVVTAAITVERLLPNGERVARALGVFVMVAGLFLIWRATV